MKIISDYLYSNIIMEEDTLMKCNDYLYYLQELALREKDNLIITVLCNVDDQTSGYENYEGDSATSEFLSSKQLQDLLTAFRSAGFETNAYIDENKFMLDVLSNKFYSANGKRNIVFNSAQKGTAVGRKSLIPAFCDLTALCITIATHISSAYAETSTSLKNWCRY